MGNKKVTAIVLAAGKGTRMHSDIPKQYMELNGYPVLYYALKTFEESFVDEVVLVCREEEIPFCWKEIVEKYHFTKVKKVVAGGKERYQSVQKGIQAIEESDYVYIHDGARPFLTQEILKRSQEKVEQCNACVVGMPVKDTIKIVDANGKIKDTPDRNYVWQMQTPQVFSYDIIKAAYEKLDKAKDTNYTDDAMVVEKMLHYPIQLVMGSYQNIKITTPEDMKIGCLYSRSKTEE